MGQRRSCHSISVCVCLCKIGRREKKGRKRSWTLKLVFVFREMNVGKGEKKREKLKKNLMFCFHVSFCFGIVFIYRRKKRRNGKEKRQGKKSCFYFCFLLKEWKVGELLKWCLFLQWNPVLTILKGLVNLFFKLRFLLLQSIFDKELPVRGYWNYFVVWRFSYIQVLYSEVWLCVDCVHVFIYNL